MREEFKFAFWVAGLCWISFAGYWAYDTLSQFLKFIGAI